MKTTFIVVDDVMLCYVQPDSPTAGVLASSIGAPHKPIDGPIALPQRSRPATRQDFVRFRVSSKGYENCPHHDFPAA
jgi:hypothetical protein